MFDHPQNTGPALPRRGLFAAFGVLAVPTFARAEWLRDEIVVYADPALRPVIAAIGRTFPQAQRVRCFCAAPRQMVALLAHDTQDDVLITEQAAIAAARQAALVASPTPALWRNRLVFAGAGAPQAAGDPRAALIAAAAEGGLALPDPSDACPIDGPALLQKLGLAEKLSGHVIGAADTDDAIATLLRGEATLALCHATQVAADPRLHILLRIPDDAYSPILYAAALSARAWSRYNDAFLQHLTKEAAPTARRLGLEVLT